MLFYKQRKQLAALFMEWAKERNAAPYPETVIAWLHCKGLIYEERVMNLLQQQAEKERIRFEDARRTYTQKKADSSEIAQEIIRFDAKPVTLNTSSSLLQDDFHKRYMEWVSRQVTVPKMEARIVDPFRDKHGHWIYRALLGADLMKTNSCYVCGESIPELQMRDKLYSFRCNRCGCATRFKGFYEAHADWNEGITYPVDCGRCAHGHGTSKPCGKQFNKTPFFIMCGDFKEDTKNEAVHRNETSTGGAGASDG